MGLTAPGPKKSHFNLALEYRVEGSTKHIFSRI